MKTQNENPHMESASANLANWITRVLVDLGLGNALSGSCVGDAKIIPMESVEAERKAA